jgi:hypothetical protein
MEFRRTDEEKIEEKLWKSKASGPSSRNCLGVPRTTESGADDRRKMTSKRQEGTKFPPKTAGQSTELGARHPSASLA